MTQGTLKVTDANGATQQMVVSVNGSGALIVNHVIADAGGVNLASVGVDGNLATQRGGSKSSLNLTAAGVIKATPGRLRRIVIQAPGSTSGAFTFNDVTTVGGAAAGNQIFTLPYNGTNNIAGAIFDVDWPCANGIVLSAVPGGGSPIVAVSYD